MNADVLFIFDRYSILTTVPYDGTYDDAVQLAKELLTYDGVSTDGKHSITVRDCETLREVEE